MSQFNCQWFHRFVSVVLNIADGKPATRYLVAVDGGQQTLEEIVKVSYHKLVSLSRYQHIGFTHCVQLMWFHCFHIFA